MNLNSIQDTTLWKRLKTGFTGEDAQNANKLAENLVTMCKDASDKMKRCIVLHKQFTLHDETHLLRVAEIMAKILGDEGIKVLNPIEITLLILSSFFHDIGMVMDDSTIEAIIENDEFKLFKANWIIDHPNYREVQRCLKDQASHSSDSLDKCVRVYNDLQNALLTDFIRVNHGAMSNQFVITNYSDNALWQINGVNYANIIGKLCLSHNQDIQILTRENGFYFDENVATYNVNMIFLAIVLRLADILDFDRERTPDSLYKSIHFTSSISLNEWEKHRSVVGWEISKERIRFNVQCTHPIYQRMVLQFMDWIDEELTNANAVIHDFPITVSTYKLQLPVKVDRSRIKPKEDSYIYHDLEFSLSRDEIVKLLMMDELYKSPSLCIRELLQNSLDALRHRKCRFKKDCGMEWEDGKVVLKHYLDEYGREVISCEDNGTGMDESIITRYLTKAGRSYYKSPEFEKEKESLLASGIEINPCSQFGIGFMSCFMIGDSITIRTRKDYGAGKSYGKPLVVEINGLNGIIVIREGDTNQAIGTSVLIYGRKKPEYLDEWIDKVRLIEVLEGYALACEFPIEAKCTIDEIKGSLSIPASIAEPKTFIERAGISVQCYKNFKQNLSDIHPSLKGTIKVSFLVDEHGALTLDNNEAYWDCINSAEKNKLVIKSKPVEPIYTLDQTSTCCDGILVCGTPGRSGDSCHHLGEWANLINLGIESFVLDIRNDIKPRLTPSRIAKEDHYNLHPSWKYLQDLMDVAQGRLWAKILIEIDTKDEIENFIKIASVYRFQLDKLPSELIWDKLYIPINDDGKHEWIKLSSVDKIIISDENDIIKLNIDEKILIEPDDLITQYDSRSYGFSAYENIRKTILRISALEVNGESQLLLHILNPRDSKFSLVGEKYDSDIERVRFIPYYDSSKIYLSILAPIRNINSEHPLALYIQKNKYHKDNNALADFSICLMFFITYKPNIDDIMSSKITNTMKHLGCRYKLVMWDEYPEDYRPDYKIWTKNHGVITLTHDKFVEWAQAKIETMN